MIRLLSLRKALVLTVFLVVVIVIDLLAWGRSLMGKGK